MASSFRSYFGRATLTGGSRRFSLLRVLVVVSAVVMAAPTAALAASGSAALAKAPKMDVCHDDDAGWQVLSIVTKGNAVTAHLNHGDALPGQPVPGFPGYSFTDTCSAEPDGPTLAPAIDVEKEVSVDEGTTWFDADDPTGPATLAGSDVFFRLTVTNTGNVGLTGITLMDSTISLTGCSIPATLGEGSSFSCVLGPETAGLGQQFNEASTTGDYGVIEVSDSDPAYYVGSPVPSVDIEKLTNGNDADDADDPTDANVPVVVTGEPVTWSYLVTNVGTIDVPGADIVVSDDVEGLISGPPSGDAGNDGILSPGEVWTYTKVGTAIEIVATEPNVVPSACDAGYAYENTGTVTVTGASDSDLSHYCNPAPVGVVLDAFNDGDFFLEGPTASTTVAATVPGGSRWVSIDDSNEAFPTAMWHLPGGESLTFHLYGENGGTYSIAYGGASGNVTNPLNLDLTTYGADRLQLVASQSSGDGLVIITLASGCHTGDPYLSCSSWTSLADTMLGGPDIFDFRWSPLTAVDLTDVDYIEVTFTYGVARGQVVLEEFRTSGP